MKLIYTQILNVLICVGLVGFLVGCADKLLDRPPLTSTTDNPKTWTSEMAVRIYMNKYLTDFFPGFANSPFDSDTFSDDFVQQGPQGNFGRSVPNSQIWGTSTLRSLNIMIDRLENQSKEYLTDEQFGHWMGVARFYRGIEHADIVATYGDIPYFDHVASDTDKDDLYRPREPRSDVMDKVYEDWKYAFAHIRTGAKQLEVNRYNAAAYIARDALREASWQKYYYKNNAQAKKFYDLAVECCDFLMSSGKYAITTDYRTLFTSESLKGNRECIIYRNYDAGESVKHSVASYSNINETIFFGGTTDLIKSYIAVDGKVWENSEVENAKSFAVQDLIKTRDSRFEATFYDKPSFAALGSYLFPVKYMPRHVIDILEKDQAAPTEFSGAQNVTDHPYLRYAEVLLNWIEAKAELADMGQGTVSQDDVDRSINVIRDRPLAKEAIAKGVKKTAHLNLSNLPNDPNRDKTVSPLIWEIRRERRMEFCFERFRYRDLERWHKLEYMDTDVNPDLLSGAWVNFPKDFTGKKALNSKKIGKVGVVNANGEIVNYNGKNANEMVGFYRYPTVVGRRPFLDLVNVNIYLSPVGKSQMDDYFNKGYVLEQTEGWPAYNPGK